MLSKLGQFFARRLSSAIGWRVRDALEAEREATVDLGKLFLRATAQLADQQHLLEVRIAELEKDIVTLKEDH